MEERRPYGSFASSAAMHGALLAAILFGFAAAPRFADSPEAIPIETVSLSDINQIMNGAKNAKPAPAPATPQPREDARVAAAPLSEPAPPPPPEPAPPPPKAAATPPPEPPPRPADKPAPEPTPKLAAKEAPAVEPPVRPKSIDSPPERPKPAAQEKPRPARNFDPNAIAKLIGEDKMATPAIAPQTASATPQGLPRHDAPHMSMSMASALDAWLIEAYLNCWAPPPTMPDGDIYVAEIRVVFKPDGSLQGRPVLVNPPPDQAWRPYADSAMRAVRKCDPLKIPAEYMPYFDQWRVETIHFDPRETQG